jgi:hypothetical protein
MTEDSACAGSNPAPLRSIIEPELAALASLGSLHAGQLGRAGAFELAGADSAHSRLERPARVLKTIAATLPAIERVLQASRIALAPPPHVEQHAHSIFHEPWWLDIATQGQWDIARVQRANETIGEMPYPIMRRGVWRVSQMPPLTRTLGPMIQASGATPAQAFMNRLDVMTEIVEQIPRFDSFYQIFDPRVDDALAFGLKGYTVSTRYTFQFGLDRSVAEVWKGLRGKTRNLIRAAQKIVTLALIDSPAEFNRFYETNLASRSRTNAYGSAIMQQLVSGSLERGTGYLLGAYGADGKLVAAIGVVWDRHAAYYLLSSRLPTAHSGSISLLIWAAIQDAIERKLTFDFDGIPNAAALRFISGFNPTLKPRLAVERASTICAIARSLKRGITPKTSTGFMPTI